MRLASELCSSLDRDGLRTSPPPDPDPDPGTEPLVLLGAVTRPGPAAEGHEGGSSLSGLNTSLAWPPSGEVSLKKGTTRDRLALRRAAAVPPPAFSATPPPPKPPARLSAVLCFFRNFSSGFIPAGMVGGRAGGAERCGAAERAAGEEQEEQEEQGQLLHPPSPAGRAGGGRCEEVRGGGVSGPPQLWTAAGSYPIRGGPEEGDSPGLSLRSSAVPLPANASARRPHLLLLLCTSVSCTKAENLASLLLLWSFYFLFFSSSSSLVLSPAPPRRTSSARAPPPRPAVWCGICSRAGRVSPG